MIVLDTGGRRNNLVSWDVAVMAMIAVSAMGFLLSDGEKRRVYWVRAMRRCLLRMSSVIRYEQPGLADLLARMDLRATPQERELTQLLHRCAKKWYASANPQLLLLFSAESARLRGYGVLSREDCAPFEGVLAELGRICLSEQLALIDRADERLREREEILARESAVRTRLIRTLGVCAGAAVFLVLI